MAEFSDQQGNTGEHEKNQYGNKALSTQAGRKLPGSWKKATGRLPRSNSTRREERVGYVILLT
jgi:hypothetical protein